jgi:prophage maintenance system killer protein
MGPDPSAPEDLRFALEQYNFILELVEQHTRPDSKQLELTPVLIRELHAKAIAGTGAREGGSFRKVSVEVRGSEHSPTKPKDVAREVDVLCDYVNTQWDKRTAFHLAAYVLWKLCWIHPFADGNGRTARALSYLILSTRLGTILPGAPTIPEQLRRHRARYFDALEAADVAFEKHDHVDVTVLESMLQEMLIQQLSGVPAISDEVQDRLHDVVDRRIRRAPPTVIQKVYGEADVAERLWAIDDHLVLQVGPQIAIQQAERTHAAQGNAFPRLLALGGATAPVRVLEDQRGVILRQYTYDASGGYAVEFEHNAAAIIENPRVGWEGTPENRQPGWELRGVLYVVRLGRQITTERAVDIFDFLVARHMMSLGA